MSNMESAVYRLKEEITLISIGDSGALLNVTSRCYYDLNETAFQILTLMENGRQYQEICAELISKFNVELRVAGVDARNFIVDLVRLGVVEVLEKTSVDPHTTKAGKGTKIYQTPLIEYKSELAVACAPAGSG